MKTIRNDAAPVGSGGEGDGEVRVTASGTTRRALLIMCLIGLAIVGITVLPSLLRRPDAAEERRQRRPIQRSIAISGALYSPRGDSVIDTPLVLFSNGEPFPAAVTLSDLLGRFWLTRLEPREYETRIFPANYLPESFRLTAPANLDAITLQPWGDIAATPLRGKVIDRDGAPISGARVVYHAVPDDGVQATAVTDARGVFTLPATTTLPLAPGANRWAFVDAPGRAYTAFRLGPMRNVTIRVLDACTLTVTLLDDHDSPVAFRNVWITDIFSDRDRIPLNLLARDRGRGRTDAAGKVRFDRLPSGIPTGIQLAFQAPPGAVLSPNNRLNLHDGDNEVTLRVIPSATLRGRVLRADGTPASGVSVWAGVSSESAIDRSWTDSDGRYLISGRLGAEVNVGVDISSVEGFAFPRVGVRPPLPPESLEVNFRLRPCARLSGSVRGKFTGRAATETRIVAVYSLGERWAGGTMGPTSSFEVTIPVNADGGYSGRVPAGLAQLQVRAYRPSRGGFLTQRPASAPLDGFAPLQSATATIPAQEEMLLSGSQPGAGGGLGVARQRFGPTDGSSEERAALESARLAALGILSSRSLTIAPGTKNRVDFSLDGAVDRHVRVTVVDSTNQPVKNTPLHWLRDDGSGVTKTDSNGEAFISTSYCPEQTVVRVWVETPRGNARGQTGVYSSIASDSMRLKLAPSPLPYYEGRVVTLDGQPVAGAQVLAASVRGQHARTEPPVVTDSKGRYRIPFWRSPFLDLEARMPGGPRFARLRYLAPTRRSWTLVAAKPGTQSVRMATDEVLAPGVDDSKPGLMRQTLPDLVLPAMAPDCRVTVRDENGAPMPATSWFVYGTHTRVRVLTDAAGSFVLKGTAREERRVYPLGYGAGRAMDTTIRPDATRVEIQLKGKTYP